MLPFCCLPLSITILLIGIVWWNSRRQRQRHQTAHPSALTTPPSLGPDARLSEVDSRNPTSPSFSTRMKANPAMDGNVTVLHFTSEDHVLLMTLGGNHGAI